MAKKITLVISQGQSSNPAKRGLEEDLVAALLFERGVEVTVVPNLYDLAPDGTGMLCLSGITGDMVVLSWLYPRGAHWILARNGIRGHEGRTLLKATDDEEEDEEKDELESQIKEDEARPAAPGLGELPNRRIYCIDLRTADRAAPYVEEVRRIVNESSVQTVQLMSWITGTPKPDQLARYLNPGAAATPSLDIVPAPVAVTPVNGGDAPAMVTRIEEQTGRRWYPVIDYSRCTNCLECLDFCLFGVYGVDKIDSILVEQPDNCKKGCPACSRVCPENAIIFPQHKTPAIAGSPEGGTAGLKIDLSQLFGAPSAIEIAAQERDTELVADGRVAVGLTIGIPKRQANKKADGPRDDLDDLVDQLDNIEL